LQKEVKSLYILYLHYYLEFIFMERVQENKKNLYEHLKDVKDFRRWQWQRHELPIVLLIVIMATLSWYIWIRAIWDFKDKHKSELIEIFWIEKNRLPNFATIWRILKNLDFNEFNTVFQKWSIEYMWVDLWEWLWVDGKVIRGTVENPNNEYQKYTSLVSVFSSKRKQVLWVWLVWTDKKSEIPVVKDLIKDLWLEWVIFTIDALHCQTETTKVIIESKNEYVLWVKWNQKNLFNALKKTVKSEK